MAQTLSNFDNAMKDDYGPGLRNAVNDRTAVWSQLDNNKESIEGRQAVWAVHTSRSTSTGSRGDGGTLPTAGSQGYSQVRDNLATIYHTVKVTGASQLLSMGKDGAFVNALEANLRGAEKDVSNEAARQSYNTAVSISSTLYLGAITGTATTGYTSQVYTFGNANKGLMRHFFVGMVVDQINASNAAVRGTTTITAIDQAAQTVTVADATSGATTGDYLARTGNFAAAATWGYELNGLNYLLGSQAYANLDPATQPLWQAQTAGSSTTQVSETLFDLAADKVQTDGDGGDIDLWISEQDNARKLAQQLQAQKRYDGREATLKGGWKGVQIQRGTLIADKYCPSNKIYGLNTEEISRFTAPEADFQWDDTGGSVLYKALDNTHAVEARFFTFTNLETLTRNSHILVTTSVPTF